MGQTFQQWASRTGDLEVEHVDGEGGRLRLYYLSTMADKKAVYHHVLPRLQELDLSTVTLPQIESKIGVTVDQRLYSKNQVIDRLLQGDIYIHLDQAEYGVYFPSDGTQDRQISSPENETNILGPKNSFVETLEVNLSLIRKYIRSPKLSYERLQVGETAPMDVALLYMEGITNPINVQTMRQRIQNLIIPGIPDASTLAQYIKDNEFSMFPQLLLSERPDRTVAGLIQGQVAVLVDGSPSALMGPTTFTQLFHAVEDSYFRWMISSFLRILRSGAILLALIFTPVYVAILTFHYEMVPVDLLISLAQSRSRVPFPPLMEAILLEGVIELLREAGARLPTKIGQTIGIVGGIVIGQAIVQAGFTSNILIIIVALGALSSFSSPSYSLGAAVRVLRFPIILLAGIWGGFGIVVGLSFLLSHLLRLTSLGSPYLEPLYPLRLSDMKDSIIRMPISFFSLRPQIFRPLDERRFDPKKGRQQEDIDE
ncbi:spore germination protein [Brevibacillus panacihumi W25]|uniref:Spore germination protein n=1 Tax=Brevibacillus panacihumi W25 TaxID=1408254 RepID=V6MFJ8_9BACL|nr:spore germination protein [Brevibacillus panacihumi]EST54158.1 spore germination protein [Brevibacillus panacihumi W25]